MNSHREIKRKARQSLHETLSVRALYLPPIPAPVGSIGPGPFYGTPIPCTVRVWLSIEALGDMKGTSFSYAEKQAVIPKLIFIRSEIDKPARGAVVSVEAGEAYRIDNTKPPEDITVMSEVVRMPAAETVGLPVPEVV